MSGRCTNERVERCFRQTFRYPTASILTAYRQSTLSTIGKKVPHGSRLTPERLAIMKIGTGFLSPAERQLFVDILFEYEAAIAFDESEMGLLDSSIESPVVIHTVPHTSWQQQNLRLPKAMQDAATVHVKEKLDHGILEFSQGPYRSRYFLVAKKKPDEYRFINDVQSLNKVIIRDSGMPSSVDEFSEDFAGYPITSAIDYFLWLLSNSTRQILSRSYGLYEFTGTSPDD